jgi:hypothetical protein
VKGIRSEQKRVVSIGLGGTQARFLHFRYPP